MKSLFFAFFIFVLAACGRDGSQSSETGNNNQTPTSSKSCSLELATGAENRAVAITVYQWRSRCKPSESDLIRELEKM